MSFSTFIGLKFRSIGPSGYSRKSHRYCC